MRNQSFHAAEAWRDKAELQVVEKTLGGVEVALCVEADHTAVPRHLLLGDGVVGVAFEAGIVDLANARMRFEKPGDFHGGCVVNRHAQRKGLEAAQQEVAAVRIDDSAHGFVQRADLLDELRAAENDARKYVVVARHVFRATVHDEVDAELERALVDGGGESAVDEREHVVLARDLAQAVEVEYVEVGGLWAIRRK